MMQKDMNMEQFDELIRKRKAGNDEKFVSGMINLTNMAMGKSIRTALSERSAAESAVEEILDSLGISSTGRKLPGGIVDPQEIMEYMIRPYGIMMRSVELEGKWYRNADGTMLTTFRESGKAVVISQKNGNGLFYRNEAANRLEAINRKNAGLFSNEAIIFYKPFPPGKLTEKDFFRFGFQCMKASDIFFIAVSLLLAALMGTMTPVLTRSLFKNILPLYNAPMMYLTIIFILCTVVGKYLIEIFANLTQAQTAQRISYLLYTAGMMRTLSMDTAFFSEFSSGELLVRTRCFKDLWKCVMDIMLKGTMAVIFCLVFTIEIMQMTPVLAFPAAFIFAAAAVITVCAIICKSKVLTRQMNLSAKNTEDVYEMINGIRKIKVCGAEEKMFKKWSDGYAMEANADFHLPVFLKICGPVLYSLPFISLIFIYVLAWKNNMDAADFYAFTGAFGMAMGAVMTVYASVDSFACLRPGLRMIRPIMSSAPEVVPQRNVVRELSGKISLVNVSFRYSSDTPPIIRDLSMEINPGDYIAICGTTGAGKSTLLRLLLGMEIPTGGSIYYDEQSIDSVDIKSLRQKIGTVLQNGQLIAGSIRDNILFGAADHTIDRAWKAAEIAGIADEIRALPMQMNTYLAEGSGGISGGQKQRILIARAVASDPKILIMDEATSALDNLTQKRVSEAIDALGCTRIVIAHRLSTIQNCSRIYVLDKGRIAEEGTYSELMEKNGLFKELVARQQI